MARSIIRSRSMITRALDRHSVEEIADGALLQEDGVITAIGGFDALKQRHPDVPVIGSGNEIMLPGFVNAHHHVGLTPVQLGSPDMPLELWWITRMVIRDLDLYLDTLYSAFEMIASGVTTVQHLHGWVPGTLEEVEAKSNQVIRAYQDVGMRASYCYAVRDQNRLMYQTDDELIASLPGELQGRMRNWFGRFKIGLDESMDLFVRLHQDHNAKRRVKVQLAPANLHWCSDAALTAFSDLSRKYDAPIHMHLVETAYQKAYAVKRGGGTALDYLDRFDLLNARLTLGHGVWLSEGDIDKVAETGVCICHNCSSNFRLRSGIAPLNRFEAKGINTAIGMDEAGINDDRDMLQEMRLVLRAHRVPGMAEADVPTMAQVLRMATAGGARTTPFGDTIGTLEVGKAADLNSLLGQRGNIIRPRFWFMLRDIVRFYAKARTLVDCPSAEGVSLGEFLAREGYSQGLVEDHVLPMCAAIWSTTATRIRDYPLRSFLRFFSSHGLLDLAQAPDWRTVAGGSREYVRRLRASFDGSVRLATGVRRCV